MPDPEYVDEEERELIEQLDDLDSGALEHPSRQRQDELREAPGEHLKNRARKMNIRIDAEELERIKRQAEREGLRYQTLIKSVLHKYSTGQLVEWEKTAA